MNTPNTDALAENLQAYRDANREARAQLAAVTQERDALLAALISVASCPGNWALGSAMQEVKAAIALAQKGPL